MTQAMDGGDAAERPLPVPDEASAPFWEACRRHELCVQRCAACRAWLHTPRLCCPRCGSLELDWPRVSGRGKIYSFVVCHPPVLPAFAARTPYAVVLVELAEDPALRLIGNLLDCAPDAIEIGMPVEVRFEDIGDEIALPQWRPARDASTGSEPENAERTTHP